VDEKNNMNLTQLVILIMFIGSWIVYGIIKLKIYLEEKRKFNNKDKDERQMKKSIGEK